MYKNYWALEISGVDITRRGSSLGSYSTNFNYCSECRCELGRVYALQKVHSKRSGSIFDHLRSLHTERVKSACFEYDSDWKRPPKVHYHVEESVWMIQLGHSDLWAALSNVINGHSLILYLSVTDIMFRFSVRFSSHTSWEVWQKKRCYEYIEYFLETSIYL